MFRLTEVLRVSQNDNLSLKEAGQKLADLQPILPPRAILRPHLSVLSQSPYYTFSKQETPAKGISSNRAGYSHNSRYDYLYQEEESKNKGLLKPMDLLIHAHGTSTTWTSTSICSESEI